VTLNVKLDGSPSKNTISTGRGTAAPLELTTTATWTGARLVLTTVRMTTSTQSGQTTKVETTETVFLEGELLVVERKVPGFGADSVRVDRITFRKGK
jgi:hypothetical protein